METIAIMNIGNIGFTAGILLIAAGAILTVAASLRPNRIEVTADSLVISGSYRYSVKLSGIQSVEKMDRLPKIKIRRNGIGWPNVKIGHFSMEGIGKCRLYVNNKKCPPYVHVVTISGEHLIFNAKNPEETAELFDSILRAVS